MWLNATDLLVVRPLMARCFTVVVALTVCANGTGHVIKAGKNAGAHGRRAPHCAKFRNRSSNPQKNLILVKGSIPGARGSLVTVRTAVKNKKAAA